MERCYQYDDRGLPELRLFLMLLKAFVDGSAGKKAEARPALVVSSWTRSRGRTRRPYAGRRIPELGSRIGATLWEFIPSRGTAAPEGSRQVGQPSQAVFAVPLRLGRTRHGDTRFPLRCRQNGRCRG